MLTHVRCKDVLVHIVKHIVCQAFYLGEDTDSFREGYLKLVEGFRVRTEVDAFQGVRELILAANDIRLLYL